MPILLTRILRGVLAMIIILPLSGLLYQAIATEIDKSSYPPPGQLVDVGGYRLHLYCIGQNTGGRPTVVLETGLGGLGSTSSVWARVQPEIAKTTRVCAYDRAGLGWSDPSPKKRDAQNIAAELHTLLQNSHTPGPYVLVGWSYGGLYVRAYASQYREEVKGLVLVDSSSPEQCASTPAWQALCASTDRTAATASVLARFGVVRIISHFQPASDLPEAQRRAALATFSTTKFWQAQNAELQSADATNTEVLDSKPLGAMPLMVLTATNHDAAPDLEQRWQAFQAGYTTLSTNGAQRVVNGATHDSLVYGPTDSKVTIEAILQVVEAARTGEQLKP
jgi:pimeloyl-ACP methyl ester carboxylesterase